MCVLIFSATFVWVIFHFKKNWVRYDKNCILIPAHYADEHFESAVIMGVNAATFITAPRKPNDTVKATNAL
jgi:hypothetical protein